MLKSALIAGASLIALTSVASAADQGYRPMFTAGINRRAPVDIKHPAGTLPTWTFKWSYDGVKYSAIFVGPKPTKTAAPITVPTYIIPMKLKYGKFTTDPTAADYTGNSPITNTVNSPLFQTGIDYNQGGTDLGNTQYEDAFQRAVLWKKASKDKAGYHVLLGQPTIEPTQAETVPTNQGGTTTAWGNKVIVANINWFDPIIEKLLTTLKIPANSLPLFITTQTYLSSGSISNCCIGGYHSYTGTQAYSHFTYISNNSSSAAFSEDVSAGSHEIGEWMDDPLTNNTKVPSRCGIYEVGDPIEGLTNFGTYPYALNGMTYHLQDLVLPSYFGAPEKDNINYNQSFQGTKFSVCQNGG